MFWWKYIAKSWIWKFAGKVWHQSKGLGYLSDKSKGMRGSYPGVQQSPAGKEDQPASQNSAWSLGDTETSGQWDLRKTKPSTVSVKWRGRTHKQKCVLSGFWTYRDTAGAPTAKWRVRLGWSVWDSYQGSENEHWRSLDTKWRRGFGDEIDLEESVERAVQFKSYTFWDWRDMCLKSC